MATIETVNLAEKFGQFHDPLLLLEPKTTLNTGNVRSERTVENEGRV